MAKRIHTELISDLSGEPAHESISFGLDGKNYEIDLAESEANELRESLAAFVQAARKTSGVRKATRESRGYDAKAVRAWARSNGIEVSERGRILNTVLEQYRAAGN